MRPVARRWLARRLKQNQTRVRLRESFFQEVGALAPTLTACSNGLQLLKEAFSSFCRIFPHPEECLSYLNSDHCTGSTRPTRKTYDAAPTSVTAPVMAKAQKNSPVRSRIMPTAIGAIIPATLPQKFSKPAHLPAVCGPARICVMVQRLGEHMPSATQEKIRMAM